MTKIIVPPFVECPDNFRCGQTVIMMILKHFLPDREWTYEDADRICYYKQGYHTWDTAVIAPMVELGFEVKHFCAFDPKEFIARPMEYLPEFYGEATVEYMLKHGGIDIALEIEENLQNVQNYEFIMRDWQWSDVEKLLNEGYLIFTWVNSNKLYMRQNREEVVSGHFVLVFLYNGKAHSVTFHDGGARLNNDLEQLQANHCEALRMGSDHFMYSAKSDKGDGGAAIIAFRLKK